MDGTIDLTAGFLDAIVTEPAIAWTNDPIIIIRIDNGIELVIQHESGS